MSKTSTSGYEYVLASDFKPYQLSADGWRSIGSVESFSFDAGNNCFELNLTSGLKLYLYFLSNLCFRVRFSPLPGYDYSNDYSYAVVNRDFAETLQLEVETAPEEFQDMPQVLKISTKHIRVTVQFRSFRIQIHRIEDDVLIHQDSAGNNLVYHAEKKWIANLKVARPGSQYFGFGEKAGTSLNKRGKSLTFFNYDNFIYAGPSSQAPSAKPKSDGPTYSGVFEPVVSENGGFGTGGETGGVYNDTEPLYNSIPFMLEIHPDTKDSSKSFCYGLFFDNVSQSYFNLANDEGDSSHPMNGQYYFGALHGALDYYFMAARHSKVGDILDLYTNLTGRAPIHPKYAFGFQQGCYGYFDRAKLEAIARDYRRHKIPCDGLHIDVDFQDNYRTFTNSEEKFPDIKEMFENLLRQGYKCSTNITGIVTRNKVDQSGDVKPYETLKTGLEQDFFLKLYPYHAGDGHQDPYILLSVLENYGTNTHHRFKDHPGTTVAFNPFQYPLDYDPPFAERAKNTYTLGTIGHYADLGNPEVQEWWGEQYRYLIESGLSMIWQDMTCPAVGAHITVDRTETETKTEFVISPYKTLPLDTLMYDFGGYKANAEVHNAFALNLVKSTYQGLSKIDPEKRFFIIARGGYAGTHRYAGIWTGDSGSSWSFLRVNVPEVINIGLSGQPVSGCDIGGFANYSGSETGLGDNIAVDYNIDKFGKIQGGQPEPELLTRWMTAGAFLPWYRNHYDGYTKAYQEPFRYGEPYISHCRKYVEYRYKLIQVFYDAMYKCHVSGMPIARAMFVQSHDSHLDPYLFDEDKADCLSTQFFVGPYILVAPVLNNENARDVYLPVGTQWYEYKDHQAPLQAHQPDENSPLTNGGMLSDYPAPLDCVPLFVAEGAIIPTRELEQYIGEKECNPITLNIYPSTKKTESHYDVYEDDEVTTAYERGQYRVTHVTARYETGDAPAKGVQPSQFKRVVSLDYTHNNYTPTANFLYVCFWGSPDEAAPSAVRIAGVPITPIDSKDALEAAESNAWYYDSELNATFIKVFEIQESSREIVVSYVL